MGTSFLPAAEPSSSLMQSTCDIEQECGRARIVHSRYVGLKGDDVCARRAGYGTTNGVWQRLESVTGVAKEVRAF